MKQFRLMLSPSVKYQKAEMEITADTKEELLEEVAWAEKYVKDKVVELLDFASKYDDTKETNVVPAPAKAPEKATANQWACIKKNETKAKMVAEELGITLDDSLSKANAYKVITKLVNKQ